MPVYEGKQVIQKSDNIVQILYRRAAEKKVTYRHKSTDPGDLRIFAGALPFGTSAGDMKKIVRVSCI